MTRTCLAICLCALVAMVGACSGRGRAIVHTSLGQVDYEYDHGPFESNGVACGTIEVHGRLYTVICNASGDPVYLVPHDAPDRRVPIMPLDGSKAPPLEHLSLVTIDDASYAMMHLPDLLMNVVLEGTAAELIAAHGIVSNGSEHELPFAFEHAPAPGLTDVRTALSTLVELPNPFAHDLQHETIVVPAEADGPAFVLHRVVGSADAVAAYLRDAGLVSVTPEVSLSSGDEPDIVVGGMPSWP